MGCITHLSSNSKCLWQCFHSVYSYLDTHSHQHLRLFIIMYMNHKWKMAGRGIYWKHILTIFLWKWYGWAYETWIYISFLIWILLFKIWRYDTIWKKPTLVFWAYNHLKSLKKWFVKLYILAKYISRCIVFQSISLLSVGVGGVNVASVDEF